MSKEKADSDYVSHLRHRFPVANEQTKNGLYVVKRTAAYMERACQSIDPAKDPVKMTKELKMTELAYDSMLHFVDACTAMQKAVLEVVSLDHKFSQDVSKNIVTPLQNFYQAKQLNRKALVRRQEQLTQELAGLKAKADAERAECKKQYELLLQVQREKEDEEKKDSAGRRDRYPKILEKLKREKKKTHKAFTAFAKSLGKANDFNRRYHYKELPDILEKMEKTEKERLDTLKQQLNYFVTLHQEIIETMQGTQTKLRKLVSELDPEAEMKRCLTNWRSTHGIPPDFKEWELGLPCSPLDILQNRFMSESGQPSEAMFLDDLDDDGGAADEGGAGGSGGGSGSGSGPSSRKNSLGISSAGSSPPGSGPLVASRSFSSGLGSLSISSGSSVGGGVTVPVPVVSSSSSSSSGRKPPPPPPSSLAHDSHGSPPAAMAAGLPPPPSRSQNVSRSASPVPSLSGGRGRGSGVGPGLAVDIGKEGILLGKRCAALYDHNPIEEDGVAYLAFKKGDVITILDAGEDDDDGWWEGELGDAQGYFPKDFVQILEI